MAKPKPAILTGELIAPKGEAAPAHVSAVALDDIVRVTVKLTPEEHLRLMQMGLRSRPRRSNQEMIREAVLRYLDVEEGQ